MTDFTPILKALSAASAKQPVAIETLRKIADREGIDVAELKQWQEKVDVLRALVAQRQANLAEPEKLKCPDCGSTLMLADGKLQHWQHEGAARIVSADDAVKLPEYEKSLTVLQNAVNNGKRDIAEANVVALMMRVSFDKGFISTKIWAKSMEMTNTIGGQAGGWLKKSATASDSSGSRLP